MDWILRETFFGHFCAGEDSRTLLNTVEFLRDRRIGAIYFYSAEADVEGSKNINSSNAAGLVSDSQCEGACDENLRLMLDSVRKAAQQQHHNKNSSDPFVAVKMTALGNPSLLTRMTTLVRRLRMAWPVLVLDPTPRSSLTDDALSHSVIDYATFNAGLRQLGIDATKEEAKEV